MVRISISKRDIREGESRVRGTRERKRETNRGRKGEKEKIAIQSTSDFTSSSITLILSRFDEFTHQKKFSVPPMTSLFFPSTSFFHSWHHSEQSNWLSHSWLAFRIDLQIFTSTLTFALAFNTAHWIIPSVLLLQDFQIHSFLCFYSFSFFQAQNLSRRLWHFHSKSSIHFWFEFFMFFLVCFIHF